MNVPIIHQMKKKKYPNNEANFHDAPEKICEKNQKKTSIKNTAELDSDCGRVCMRVCVYIFFLLDCCWIGFQIFSLFVIIVSRRNYWNK